MNENRFTGKAGVYAKYRPTYPSAFVNYLYTEVGFCCDSVIADIGSGTGILTELLLLKGSTVYGIEPNMDMRNTAEDSLSQYEKFKSIGASAEDTGLPDSSVDFITVAQAFHWFDRAKFKDECQRILRDKGKVILVWNSRDEQSELIRENDRVNQVYCPEFKGFSGGMRGEGPEEYRDFFRDGICEHKVFRHDLMFDEEGFIGRNMSASYAPKEGDGNYAEYISELRLVFEKYSDTQGQDQGRLCMPNLTRSYVGEV